MSARDLRRCYRYHYDTDEQTCSEAPFILRKLFWEIVWAEEPMNTFQTEICARRRREIFEAKDLLGWIFLSNLLPAAPPKRDFPEGKSTLGGILLQKFRACGANSKYFISPFKTLNILAFEHTPPPPQGVYSEGYPGGHVFKIFNTLWGVRTLFHQQS